MGTASTMACITAALGLMPLKGASAPAVSSARLRIAEETGSLAVTLAQANTNGERNCTPQAILSEASFLNALTVLQAIGGSTNAIVHLLAIANRHPAVHGKKITLQTLDDIGRSTPLLIDLKPSGANYMTDFHNAGGMVALLHALRPLLRLHAMTVSGRTLGQVLDETPFRTFPYSAQVIRPLSNPLYASSSLVVVRGNIAPNGAVIKASASKDRSLLRHAGPAVVFEDSTDLASRLDDPDLPVTRDSVLVLKNIGPIGNPGMPEAGLIPLPRKLASQGVSDMLRLSDGRMSGTAGGTIVLHISPEAAVAGSVFGVVRTGDVISLDIEARKLQLEVPEEELEGRIAQQAAGLEASMAARRAQRGYRGLYVRSVNQAQEGADFDFLTASGLTT
jgi:dihydroxy-acid dehydratase